MWQWRSITPGSMSGALPGYVPAMLAKLGAGVACLAVALGSSGCFGGGKKSSTRPPATPRNTSLLQAAANCRQSQPAKVGSGLNCIAAGYTFDIVRQGRPLRLHGLAAKLKATRVVRTISGVTARGHGVYIVETLSITNLGKTTQAFGGNSRQIALVGPQLNELPVQGASNTCATAPIRPGATRRCAVAFGLPNGPVSGVNLVLTDFGVDVGASRSLSPRRAGLIVLDLLASTA